MPEPEAVKFDPHDEARRDDPRQSAELDEAFHKLSESALRALGAAEFLRALARDREIRMGQFLYALYRTNTPTRAAITRSIDTDADFRGYLRNLPTALPADELPGIPPETLPPLSKHVADALLAARGIWTNEKSKEIVGAYLFAGAMEVERCSTVRRLVDEAHVSTAVPLEPSTFSVYSAAKADQPTDEDLIGHQKIVDSLAELLTGKSTTFPLTMAIAAPWGGGKSSVMKMLEAKLRAATAAGWLIVKFPAWRYETGEQIWAAMAKATYDAAMKKRNPISRLWFRSRLDLRRRNFIGTAARIVAVGASGFVGAVLGANVVGGASTAPGEVGVAVGGIGGSLLVGPTLLNSLGDSFKRAVESFAAKPRVENGDGFTADAAKHVDALIEQLLKGGGQVAIFIDDLDRCTPRNLVRVVEAVNQLFIAGSELATPPPFRNRLMAAIDQRRGRTIPLPRLVFIMGMDRRVVARGIETEYADLLRRMRQARDEAHTDFGVAFLDKIVQLWVTLPRPTPEEKRALLVNVAGIASGDSRADESTVSAERRRLDAALARLGTTTRSARIAVVKQLASTSDPDLAPALREASQAFLAEASVPDAADSPDVWAAMDEGLGCLDANPRQIKRFNNAFRLQLNVAARSELVTISSDLLGALARWVAIRLRWADLAGQMDEHPELLEELQSMAITGQASVPRNGGTYASWQIPSLDTAQIADVGELKAAFRRPHGQLPISELPFTEFLTIS